MPKHIDVDVLKAHGFVLAKVKRKKDGEVTEFITVNPEDAPEADVVSKSEYKKIFDEIEKIIDKHYNKEVFGSNDYDDLEKEAIINFSDAISRDIENLKEKRLTEIEAEELGEWIMSPDGVKPMTCSKCGLPALLNAGHNEFNDYEICRYASEHCPHCGKRMKNAER